MLLGLSLLCAEFACCQCTKLIHFLTCTGIPCGGSHCENGLVRCCLYRYSFFPHWSCPSWSAIEIGIVANTFFLFIPTVFATFLVCFSWLLVMHLLLSCAILAKVVDHISVLLK